MGKFERKKKSTVKVIAVVAVVIVVLVAFALFVIPKILHKLPGEEETPTMDGTETQDVSTAEAEPVPESVSVKEFPLTLENGNLEIESVFQFDGINPDCGNQEGNDVASIMVKNTSDIFLTEAKIEVELADGAKTHFIVTNLPAGKTAMVFSTDNTSIEDESSCVKLSCNAVWDDTTDLIPVGISVSVDGMTITLTNNTAQDIPGLIIYCRAPLGEEYFGGMAYEYTVDNLPANGSTTVEAVECIMGLAEVVRVAIN